MFLIVIFYSNIIIYLYYVYFHSFSAKNFKDRIYYCERFLELMIDIEAQLPTRRFFNVLMDSSHLIVRSKLSTLKNREDGTLFGEVSHSLLCITTLIVLTIGHYKMLPNYT